MNCGANRQSEAPTSGLPKRLQHDENWQSDAAYIAAQDKDSSWSSLSEWGEAAAKKFVGFGESLSRAGELFHDDSFADFGGNDGYAAHEFFRNHAIKPLVVDCEPKRLDHAGKVYGLPTYEAFIESMKELADKSIDWGFCSHTLEHTRQPEKAVREIARIIRRGCLFILPIEDREHADMNEAHSIHADSLREWEALVSGNGWKVMNARRPNRNECFIMARPL